jgi:hypothetical protein
MQRGATMKKFYRCWCLALVMAIGAPNLWHQQVALAQTAGAAVAQTKPAEIQVPGALIPTRVLVQGPAETVTELQTICLFASAPENTLHGSLLEMNEKLKGLLEQIRQPTLFRGELGETIVVPVPAGSLGAKKLLIVGLGDSRVFAPQNMDFVGAIVYRESTRMGVAHPYFAPTVLDGGVTRFSTGEIAENFVAGFLRAARTEKILKIADASAGPVVQDLTFLAGPSHAADTQQGIERAFAASSQSAKSNMRMIYEEDQKNRSDVDGDTRRRAQVRQLIDEGQLQSAEDYYYAAFIFQHGQKPADYLYAHVLAATAVSMGLRNGQWLSGATLDRYLQSMNQAQIFGTQFGHSGADPIDQEVYDRAMVSDALRALWCIVPLSTQDKILADLRAGKEFASTKSCPRPGAQFDK